MDWRRCVRFYRKFHGELKEEPVNKAFDKIKELMARNATHRKGFRIADQTPLFHLKYAAGEMLELAEARWSETEDNELHEFADVMNCMQLYAIKRGWTEDQVEAAQIEKLETRFDKEE